MSPPDDLAFAGPGELAELVRRGEVTPRELVELCLRRIEALDPRLNAFRVVLAEEALAEADRIGAGASEVGGDAAGPLAGVPVAIKDDSALAGQPTTYGSRGSSRVPAPADAETVRRLRAAGAIPIGVTNVPELMIFPWTASDANGVTRNPWDTGRTPGGSSGGSAAAVAAGLVPVATGSDGGGSIRIPAACCGLVGLKPTRGRVSPGPASEEWLGLSVRGALTRTVTDSALLLDVLRGTLPSDAEAWPEEGGNFQAAARRPPGRLRIAASTRIPPGVLARIAPEVSQAHDRTARLLAELGHEVEERDPAYGAIGIEFTQTFLRGILEDFERLEDPLRTERTTRRLASAGRVLVSPRRRDALRARRPRTVARILSLWDEYDVLLTPGLTRTALPAEGGYGRATPLAFDLAARFTPWTPPFNLTGQPAMTIPAGIAADGLPLSVQLVGRLGEEGRLLSLAAQLEAAQPWAALRPPVS